MLSSLQLMAWVLACFSVLASFLITTKLRQPVSFIRWGMKVWVSAFARFFATASMLSILLAFTTDSLWVLLPGIFGLYVFMLYILGVGNSVHAITGFTNAYGTNWEKLITPAQKTQFLSSPVSWTLPTPTGFSLQKDIPFCTIPGTDRQLLCDIWHPADNLHRSGLAFIYFHGSAWGVLDKDFGTRTLFKHLVSQGHIVMDIAYRLFPETNMAGMVQDVYRATSWLKGNADIYHIDPERIVIGGASAGGHLALMAAYSTDARFRPDELGDCDLSVHAVIAAYGPSDLEALYYHTGQHLTSRKGSETSKMPEWVQKMMGDNFHRLGVDKDASAIGVLPAILGCYPKQCPEEYALFSPITHVHKNCPHTLILQGEHDIITPVDAAWNLYKRLNEEEVPVAMYLIPQTDHAFDLIFPKLSPVAHTAFYLIERFLAIQVNNAVNVGEPRSF